MRNRIIFVGFTCLAVVLLVLSGIGILGEPSLGYIRILSAIAGAIAFWLSYGWSQVRDNPESTGSVLALILGVAMVMGLLGSFIFLPEISLAAAKAVAGSCIGLAVAALVSVWRDGRYEWDANTPAPNFIW